MKRTINIITLVLLLYFATEAQALDYNQLKRYDITDPSPMAMQYLQVTSPQPALLTGAVQFSVPLYTAECEGIKLPFSLEYKSNGVKVYDEPCPVGYGWTFLPAFRVSCRIMGRPDTQYRSKAQDGAHINDWNDRTKYEYAYRSVTSYPYDTYTDYVTHESKNTQRHDAEHDIYTIMLPDRNLTVVWDRDFTNGFVGVNIDDYKIEADSLLSYIRVTDPKGYVYHYGEAGEEHIATRCQTEWLLSWIQLPSGRRITFEWESGDTVTDNMFQVSPVVLIYPIAYYNIFASEQQRDVLRSRLEYLNHKIIKRVTLPNATVNLSYANYCSGSFLSSMSVTNIDNENIFSSYLDYNIESTLKSAL